MTIYNGQLWLLYFEIASIRLGGHTCWRDFLDFIHDYVFHYLIMEHGSFYLSTYFLQTWAICVHASLGYVIILFYFCIIYTCIRNLLKNSKGKITLMGIAKPC
jgi:hypothetical protein